VSTVQLPENEVEDIIGKALDEDTAQGDVTSEALIPPDLAGRAEILVKEKGVLAGIDIAARVFHRVDPQLKIDILLSRETSSPVSPAALTPCSKRSAPPLISCRG
jgi:nicotinate-nucleotide pyrophosphorylase (carboxylating)